MRRYYTLEILEAFYRSQDQSLSETEVKAKAKALKKALNSLDINWTRSNQRFYTHNQLQGFFKKFN